MAWDVVDLFSGAGGASFGFHAHEDFRIVGAADAQLGKPSSGPGKLGCNASYELNIGVRPVETDLGTVDPAALGASMGLAREPEVLIACPPCTGFSRTVAHNHLRDDARNSLVGRTAMFVREFRPEVLLMENARELVMGRFSAHLGGLTRSLRAAGYRVRAETHLLNRFGLPQRRERAVVVAVRSGLPMRGLSDLWAGYGVDHKATHVRRAIWELPPIPAGHRNQVDPMHAAPSLGQELTRRRLLAIPHDGGGWIDLIHRADGEQLMTPAIRARLAANNLGSHPDVYGRMWWDRPAPTIKRECGHVGNGRYSHPEQDRLCSVREMGILNGFPGSYQFGGTSLSNMYRHIGDAVPPLIGYQLAALARWILTNERPAFEELILPDTHLRSGDIERLPQRAG